MRILLKLNTQTQVGTHYVVIFLKRLFFWYKLFCVPIWKDMKWKKNHNKGLSSSTLKIISIKRLTSPDACCWIAIKKYPTSIICQHGTLEPFHETLRNQIIHNAMLVVAHRLLQDFSPCPRLFIIWLIFFSHFLSPFLPLPLFILYLQSRKIK